MYISPTGTLLTENALYHTNICTLPHRDALYVMRWSFFVFIRNICVMLNRQIVYKRARLLQAIEQLLMYVHQLGFSAHLRWNAAINGKIGIYFETCPFIRPSATSLWVCKLKVCNLQHKMDVISLQARVYHRMGTFLHESKNDS